MNRTMEINCFELSFIYSQFTKHKFYIAHLFIQVKKHNERSLKNMKLHFKRSLTLLDENILYGEICWFLHCPTVHKASFKVIGEGINLFCIKQKEGFKSVWPNHTSWISHGAVKLTSFEIYSFHVLEFRSRPLIPYSDQNKLKVDLTWYVYELFICLVLFDGRFYGHLSANLSFF